MPQVCYHGIISRHTKPWLYHRVVDVSLGVNKVSRSSVFFAYATEFSRRWKILLQRHLSLPAGDLPLGLSE